MSDLIPLQLATMIAERVAADEQADPQPDWQTGAISEWFRRRDAFADQLIQELTEQHGARFRHRPPHEHHLKLLGVNVSCTGGKLAMLRSWAGKVRRLHETNSTEGKTR